VLLCPICINTKIWENGFTASTLTELSYLAEEVKNGNQVFERIPQAQLPSLSQGSKVLCEAAIICRGCPPTESESRELFDYKDIPRDGIIQKQLVEVWAKARRLWFENPERLLSKRSVALDYGTESAVYFDIEDRAVWKLISLKHYNVLRLALDRIIIHNAIFPASSLVVKGFGRNKDGQFVVIARQNYIVGTAVSEDERRVFMTSMGFVETGFDYGMGLNYNNDEIYIGDLNPLNVIKGENGIHVIDADCRLNVPTLGCNGKYIIPQFPNKALSPMFNSNPIPAWMNVS